MLKGGFIFNIYPDGGRCNLILLLFQPLKPTANRFGSNPAKDIFKVSVNQQLLGFVTADTARLHIKKLFFIKFAAGGAVRTFNIIGKNLKFRLNVNFGAVTQQKRLMQLGAFGFDRMGRNVDFTLKTALGISADHTFYQL